jgi:tRNA-specific 2-thiouridylase
MPTIYVGLSGGVDSSVSAALLKEQGYTVVGVYMKNWTADVAGVACPWKQDLADARAAAAVLDIPFKVFDFQEQYRTKVVEAMVAEYAAGRTPNPDVLCNQEIKFKLFLELALADGADLIATGHYAQVWHPSDAPGVVAASTRQSPYHQSMASLPGSTAPSQSSPVESQTAKLIRAVDDAKDQTYFLYRVTTAALAKSLFPVGHLPKPEVRRLATQYGLPTASKPDSQGICFVGEVGIRPFLAEYITPETGDIIDQSGHKLGTHEGAAFYTVGQRHGLGVGGGGPYYVTARDVVANTVTVTTDPADLELSASRFTLVDAHWIGREPAVGQYCVRLRHRGALVPCSLEQSGGVWHVTLNQPQRAVAAGQSAVIYDGDEVLGGGFIG